MLSMEIKNLNKIHFIGIGGIGISAIARMMVYEGKIVTGTNNIESPETLDDLRKAGVDISLDIDVDKIPKDTDLIVYSIAWDQNEPEYMKEVKSLGIPVITYPEMLGIISKDKKTVAVAGTHGKTTTTAMIAEIVLSAGLDPTVIVGSFLLGHESNFVAGKSNLLIAEACEYKRSFLNLSPNILVITNVDEDHLDYYKDLADIQSAFRELAEKVPADGFIICDPSDERVKPVLNNVRAEIVDYTKIPLADLKMKMAGEHNKKNAAAAIAAAGQLGVEQTTAEIALGNFRGTWRRFQYKGETKNGAIIYDDYAHHPTEIRATLAGARETFPDKKLVVFFQPHLYSRTKSLLSEFAQSFAQADQVFVLPIYAAREPADPDISSEILVREINQQKPIAEFINDEAIVDRVRASSHPDSLLLFVGAGDISAMAQEVSSKL